MHVLDLWNLWNVVYHNFFFSQLSSSAGVWVFRTYEDFVWLRQSLFSQENLPGLQGIIVSELSNSQLNIIAWQRYCKALEFYLQQVAAHPTLCKCNALDSFLINSESPGRQRGRKGIFNRLSQAVEERRKESHKNERNKNINLAALSKVATELALACGHFSTSLHLCVNQDDAARNFEKVGSNNLSTLGLGLDLESRYQEEMLFRRTCKLIELKSVKKSTKKAKANKREVVCINLRYVICYIMIERFHSSRVNVLKIFLIGWCEEQLKTAKKFAELYSQHLEACRNMYTE
uniref:PX domain-containing protein n=2 Tax=Cyprinus carpio TaxID=7962 RepID=A0A8C1DK69_CYPCA